MSAKLSQHGLSGKVWCCYTLSIMHTDANLYKQFLPWILSNGSTCGKLPTNLLSCLFQGKWQTPDIPRAEGCCIIVLGH